jgi:Ca2+-binding RTX toxin-like protein
MAIVNGSNNSETLNAADGVTNDGDVILGNGGNDTIYGLGGNDVIQGGLGADTIHGGDDIDTANYIDSTAGVTVNLKTGKGKGGSAEGDVLSGIENLTGSNHNDTLFGDDGKNVLYGRDGHDTLKGFGGLDTLWGGKGDDTLTGWTWPTPCTAKPATTSSTGALNRITCSAEPVTTPTTSITWPIR